MTSTPVVPTRDRILDAALRAYAFTKALGERSLVETRNGVPVAIVRPSIIESALAEPVPGWIRGFRMAEPVIAAYARGLLKEFPGVPEGVVDVIPVDLVVAAILATAGRGPHVDAESGEHEPDIIQIASGAANPFCLLYTSPSPRDLSTSRMPSSA